MKFKNLLIIKALVCLIFGIPYLLVPGTLINYFGATLGTIGIFTARQYGAALIGNMFLTWFARNAGGKETQRPILLHLFFYDAIGFVVTLMAILSGIFNTLAWGPAVVYLFFTIFSGFLLIKK